MIESMAGKSGALHGICHDASPFQFSEEEPAIDYFGKLLVKGEDSKMSAHGDDISYYFTGFILSNVLIREIGTRYC